jgi:hypothetical protein
MSNLWGLVPLLGVGWAYADYGRAAELLWACNVAAALLGVGLLAGSPRAVWTGTVGLLAALPVWLCWALAGQDEGWHALITHLVSPGLGLWALRRIPRPPDLVAVSVLGLVGWGALTRLVTPAELDVNLVFQPLWVQGLALLVAVASLAAVARGLEPSETEAGGEALMRALDLGDTRRRHAFFAHFERAARRGPGDKRALKALLAQLRER